ncbi:MAG: helix-turn-helix transcriptional regulator [Rothia sp. (in: high G+C Gram-positive bacteria)]|uniref:helix-turn-helix domain-containing protein n=1 Tax=Rothia sp. (in: high G+C Gram-positive bacteria) TaxID=1885016 RepID=UPI0026E00A03|nr:helix-turn-helix transcriptional regulator [Rothia sp. (in: high G+C Gram-positive bacteria)]MDO5749666.1 helix-turn-helix transcriptional regulator [Rothia sp. (in: high G+C Gram-positive bacteria)]
MVYIPTKVRRASRTIGEQLRNQRKLMGLTAQMVADRSGITTVTLRRIEQGESVRTDVLFRVLRVLHMLDAVVDATDPYQTDVGRLRAAEQLPKSVRPKKVVF